MKLSKSCRARMQFADRANGRCRQLCLQSCAAAQKTNEIKRECSASRQPHSRRSSRTARCPAKSWVARPLLDETCSKPWKKLRLLTSCERRKCRIQGPSIIRVSTWGYSGCRFVQDNCSRGAVACYTRYQLAWPAPRTCRSRLSRSVGRPVLPGDRRPGHVLLDAQGHRSRHVFGQAERHASTARPPRGLFVHPLRSLGLRHQLLHHLDVQVGP